MLAYVTFRRGQSVDRFCVDYGDMFFLYRLGTGKVIGMADKGVNKRQRGG